MDIQLTMPKKPAVPPPNRLREFRKAARLKQAELARLVGTTKEMIGRLERGERTLGPKWTKLLGAVLKRRPWEFFKDSDRLREGVDVPILGVLSSEDRGYAAEGIPKFIEPPETAQLVAFVIDTSLRPAYERGDVVMCHKDNETTEACLGKECVVKTRSGALYIKRVYPGTLPGTYRLISVREDDLDNVQVEWARPVLWVRRQKRPLVR